MARPMKIAASLACVASAAAFTPAALPAKPCHGSSLQLRTAHNGASAVSMQAAGVDSRRSFLKLAVAAGIVAPHAADASVFFDTERYGDKELKVSLLNKIKQQFRALYEKKPELLVPMFKIALAGALTYNRATGKGGMDGTAVKLLADDEDPLIQAALGEIKRIYKELSRQTQITFADVIAYSGAVAIEATGGPRTIIQLGRTDGKYKDGDALPPSAFDNWDFEAPDAKEILSSVAYSGLNAKDAVLIAGTLGALESAGSQMAQAIANKKKCNPDEEDCTEEEEGYYGLYSPVTIVSETKKEFGKNRGASAVNSNTGFDSARIAGLAGEAKFGNQFLVSAASGKSTDPLAKALVANEETKKFVQQYGNAGKSREFAKDAEKLYIKLTELGRSDTS